MRDDPRVALAPVEGAVEEESTSLFDVAMPLVENLRLLLAVPLFVGLLALGVAFLIKPTFTARTTILPPLQQGSSAAISALASLGALAGLSGGAASVKTPADQYVALMQSTTVADRLIDHFGLMKVYEAKYRIEARRTLADNVRITVGKKDGLITVEVDDKDPHRAADLANGHIDELRRMADQLALTEAQQRRMFFEQQMEQARDRLIQAQQALMASGFNAQALKAEPKTAAEEYARLKAEATSVEVRLATLRRSLAEDTTEVRQAASALAALRAQLAKAEAATQPNQGPDYVGKYREFKYQETLFDLLSKQYEVARVDESREGPLIQVVDPATPPERKSRPKRALIAVSSTILTLVALIAVLLVRDAWRAAATRPRTASKVERLRAAFGRRSTRR